MGNRSCGRRDGRPLPHDKRTSHSSRVGNDSLRAGVSEGRAVISSQSNSRANASAAAFDEGIGG